MKKSDEKFFFEKTHFGAQTGDLCPGALMILNELQLPRLFWNFDFFLNFFFFEFFFSIDASVSSVT